MAYTYARRKELAAARLAAAGIDTGGRNPEKVLRTLTAQRRAETVTALAQRQSSYRGGGLSRPGRTAADIEQRVRGIGAGKRVPLHQDVPQAGARVTTSKSARAIRGAIREAAAGGKHVVLYVTGDDGTGPKTRVIDGRGGVPELLAGGGPTANGGDGGADVSILGKVQIVAAAAGGQVLPNGGISAAALLAFLDTYDDMWHAIADLWAEVYS